MYRKRALYIYKQQVITPRVPKEKADKIDYNSSGHATILQGAVPALKKMWPPVKRAALAALVRIQISGGCLGPVVSSKKKNFLNEGRFADEYC